MSFKDIYFNAIVASAAGYLYAHDDAHTKIKGMSFFGDHDFLGETYEAFIKAKDKLVEDADVDGFVFTRQEIESAANENLDDLPDATDANGILQNAQAIEEGFQDALQAVLKAPECSGGTQSFVSDLQYKSRKRFYKIKHRLG